MTDYRRVFLLILIMAGAALITGGGALAVLYQGGLERDRAHLFDLVDSNARLLEALATFDQRYSTYPEGAAAGSIQQFINAHREFHRRSLGESGEITMAKRDGDAILFLMRQRHAGVDLREPIPWSSSLAEPMRRALSGQTGTMIGIDYVGNRVVAAYRWLPVLGVGLVAKLDVAEIRRRFFNDALTIALIAFATTAAAAALFYRVSEPIVRRLRENEARFRQLFENMASGAAVFAAVDGGRDFVFRDLNRSGESIADIRRDEVIGRRVTAMFPGVQEVGLLAIMERAWRTGKAEALPGRFYRDDRIAGWRDNVVYRLPTGEVVVLFDDVTERKMAEEALSESEKRFRSSFENAAVGIAHVGIDGHWLRVNDRLCDIVGYSREELLARTFQDITHPDDLASDLERFALLMRGEIRTDAMEKRYFHKDGHIVWVQLTTALQRDDHGQPLYCISVVEDIGPRKRAETEMRRLYRAIEQSPVSIVMTDVAGNIIYVNPRFCEVTGYDRDEALGRNPRILQSGNTDRAVYEELWATISRGEVWNGELQNRKKNGELYWELASIAPVKDDGDGVIGFVAVKEDITERRATEAQLRQAQKMQAIGQLTGGIAHDFNNLLTIIIGNLQLLGEGIGNQAPHAGRIADAMWAAQRGGELTHRLLAFARRQPLKPTRANLNTVARGMTDLLRRTLGAAITIREDLAADLPDVLIDTGEMERALVNLAINARDAMGQGGTLTLETGTVDLDEDYTRAFADVAPGHYAMLAVSDTGSGMPADMLAHIFEPFFTTKPAGGGSGLGLSMVYGFVKQSGGHISVYSEVGRGTTFKLFFPLVGVEASATLAEAAPAGATSAFRGDGLVALVVEDEEKLRVIAARILADLGFSVLEAESGEEALRHTAHEPRLDLLFTDLELPGGMPGDEVAAAMRRRFPEVKVLRTTGYSPRQAAAGDIPLLAKPYTRHDLIQRITALFR